MPDQTRYEASCPHCGSTDLREVNIAEAWAMTGGWQRDETGRVDYESDLDESGDYETADTKPILCYECQERFEPEAVRLVPLPVWLPEDSVAASAEGWDVFNAHDDDGEYDAPEIQRDDEVGKFEGDAEVWKHLWGTHDREPTALQLKALAVVVFASNRDEIKQISRALGMKPEQFVNGVRAAWYAQHGVEASPAQ